MRESGAQIACRWGWDGDFCIRVLRQVVLVREERAHTPQHEDTLASVHHCQFVLCHQLFATMSSDEFKIGKKIPLLVMRRGIKYDIQKLGSQLFNNIA